MATIQVTSVTVQGFEIQPGSLVFVNGIVVPSTEYVYSGYRLTFKYLLSKNDRVTVVK